MGVACALVLLFLIMPILALVPMSFSGTRWLVLPPTDLSIRWYVEFFTHRDWREATQTSLKVAGAAMVLASGLGTLAGVGLARARFPGRGLARGVLIAPLIVPVMIMAIASYWLFAQFGLIGSRVALVLAHGVLAVPYVVLNVEAATHAVDSRLEQAARMLGANGWQAFWRVTLPLIRAGVLAGALFAFITSLDEVVVAMFLSGTSAITLPKLMWDSITSDELSPIVTAVASLQIGMALAVYATAELLRARGARLAFARPGGDGPGDARGAAGGPPLAAAGAAGEYREPVGSRLSSEPLRLVGLSKRFGAIVALAETTLDVAPGEFITILGPSGSGKTTLLNMIAGFEAPTSGEIFIGTTSLTRHPPNRRNVGMVFQDYALFPHMTVFANVAFPLRLRRVAERETLARVNAMLDVVQLTGLNDRYPRQLSGGQQQRVALARALIFRPPVLLMDEPFGALDRSLRESMQGELRRLHGRLGVTILFVTHDQDEAMALSDRIGVISRGRLQQIGRPEELYEAPVNEFVASFLGESNLLRGIVAASVGDALHVVTPGGTEFLMARQVGTATRATILWIRPESLGLTIDPPSGAHAVQGTVEEVVYLGGIRRYTVRINARETLVVRRPNQAGTREFGIGSPVYVEWDPRDLRLL